ncbi:MAG: NAD(P)-dependent oxidoreductase [Vicinamibacteraceae bacterium]
MRRVKALLLPSGLHDPWVKDLLEAVDSRHEIAFYKKNALLAPQLAGVEIVIDQGGINSTHEMADLAKVKLWQILGTGFDHFDLEYWREKKIPVANTPGHFSAVALAECAMMFMLMLARRWRETQENLRQGKFYYPIGAELGGWRLLLLGFGASARELARRAAPFGMKISAIDVREIPADERREFHLEAVGKPADLDDLLPGCDYLSLHLHLNPETRQIIDARRLGLMKPSGFLINVARGALVDEEALCAALREGRLAGAGLDVFSSEPMDSEAPILKLPNVVATPHISGTTDGTSRNRAAAVLENMNRIAEGLEPLYRID